MRPHFPNPLQKYCFFLTYANKNAKKETPKGLFRRKWLRLAVVNSVVLVAADFPRGQTPRTCT
jgi:hypothetical protein